MIKHFLLCLLCCALSFSAYSHNPNEDHAVLREWRFSNNKHVHATLLLLKGDQVLLEKGNKRVQAFPLSAFSEEDQQYIRKRYAQIEEMNSEHVLPTPKAAQSVDFVDYTKLGLWGVATLGLGALLYFFSGKRRLRYLSCLISATALSLIYAYHVKSSSMFSTCVVTDPLTIDAAFIPFKPNVATSWDQTYFYVESKGIPTTHPMMAGITGWQQQVPIPQCYVGNNPWSIPLNPVIAASPIPVNPAHFSRGAIAIAVNGVPIFNPYTNTGVDALLDGQLDNWGGHCGRADDYHYHVAPLHLYGFTANTLPIAYGLDGFAVYGAFEPDGSPMQALDVNHGHFGSNGVYHYHGSAAAPYMIANMVGQVTEDSTHQLIPQAHAKPVRPSLTPLQGAVITGCVPNGNNGYTVSYTKSGQNYQVMYSWTNNGVYTFNFISPSGTTTSTYNGFVQCQVPTSVADLQDDGGQIALFPNPSHDAFSLQFTGLIQPQDIQQVAVFSATGQLLRSFGAYQAKYITTGMEKGVYIVLVQTARNIFLKKLVIE